MQDIFRRRRLWLAAAVVAAAVIVAGAPALVAGPASSHAQRRSPPIRYGIDDSLPQGPSDPSGLLGVPARGAGLPAPVRAEKGTTR